MLGLGFMLKGEAGSTCIALTHDVSEGAWAFLGVSGGKSKKRKQITQRTEVGSRQGSERVDMAPHRTVSWV